MPQEPKENNAKILKQLANFDRSKRTHQNLLETTPPGVMVDQLISNVQNKRKSMNCRKDSAWALVSLDYPQALDFIVAALKSDDSDVRVCMAAGFDIDRNGTLKINAILVETLISALSDENYYVRGTSADALGLSKDTRAVVPLINALKDHFWDVRRKAVMALGRIGDRRAIEPLNVAAENEKQMGDWIRSRIKWDFGNS